MRGPFAVSRPRLGSDVVGVRLDRVVACRPNPESSGAILMPETGNEVCMVESAREVLEAIGGASHR